jgi:hypothetical protein
MVKLMAIEFVLKSPYLPLVRCHPRITALQILHYLPYDKLGVSPDVKASDAYLNYDM